MRIHVSKSITAVPLHRSRQRRNKCVLGHNVLMHVVSLWDGNRRLRVMIERVLLVQRYTEIVHSVRLHQLAVHKL